MGADLYVPQQTASQLNSGCGAPGYAPSAPRRLGDEGPRIAVTAGRGTPLLTPEALNSLRERRVFGLAYSVAACKRPLMPFAWHPSQRPRFRDDQRAPRLPPAQLCRREDPAPVPHAADAAADIDFPRGSGPGCDRVIRFRDPATVETDAVCLGSVYASRG